MAVVAVEEIIKRVGEVIGDDDTSLSIMEDLSDTFGSMQDKKIDWDSDDNPHKKRADGLAARYKARFYSKDNANKKSQDDEVEDNPKEYPTIEELLEVKEE